MGPTSRLILFAVRHTAPLQSGVCAGSTDFPVEPPEAALPALLAQPGLELATTLLTSPSRRCRDLARPLATSLGLTARVEDRLRELHFGEWESRSWQEIHDHDQERLEAWGNHWLESGPPAGESARAMTARVEDALKVLAPGTAILVTHAGPIRALRVLYHGQSWEQAFSEPVPYATWVCFSPAPRRRREVTRH